MYRSAIHIESSSKRKNPFNHLRKKENERNKRQQSAGGKAPSGGKLCVSKDIHDRQSGNEGGVSWKIKQR
jgi:hypothetical protein